MLVPTLLVAICVASSTVAASDLDKPYYDLEDVENIFREFVELYGKVYDRREYFERLKIFKDSLQDINNRNEKYPMTVFRVNHMADLRPAELEQYFGFKPSNVTAKKVSIPDSQKRLRPASKELDWRKKGVVSHVKNQGRCSSCYIFSAIGNIEGQYAIWYHQSVALSEGQALDCLQCGSCDGGIIDEVMSEFGTKEGIESEEDYAYTPAKQTCHGDDSKVAVPVERGVVLDIPDEDTLLENLENIGPLAVGMNGNDLPSYQTGILIPDKCKGQPSNHGVLLVGYGEENGTKFWIIKNSWGEDWGEAGYVRLLRGVDACRMGTSYTASVHLRIDNNKF